MDKPPPGKKDLDFNVPGGKKDRPKIPNPPMPVPEPGVALDLDMVTIRDKKLRDVDVTLSNRLFGDPENKEKKIESDFNVFHVLGQTCARR